MSKVKKEITVQAPVDLVYRVWHNFENFPRFMHNIEDVRVVGGGRSHWKARGPLGASAEWDAEVTLDEPNRAIGWRSIRNSGIETAGRVNFEDAGNATKVGVVIEYAAPGGVAGEVVTKIFSDPERQVAEDLTRFKQTIENGEELSGLVFGNGSGEALGGSMGPVTGRDLDAIAGTNTAGVSPQETDDPAIRNQSGADFGESSKDLPG